MTARMTPGRGIRRGDLIYDVDWANPNLSWAAGGIVSNARDISRFYSALLSGRILSSASLAKMKETVDLGQGAVRPRDFLVRCPVRTRVGPRRRHPRLLARRAYASEKR